MNDMKIDKDLSLKTDRFVLRAPNKSDIPHIFDAAQHEGFTDGMLWDPPKTKAELEKPLMNSLKSWDAGEAYNFTIEDISTGEFIGRISIRHEVDKVYNVGFWTHPRHQSQGVMTEALEEVLRFGFEKLSADRIEACHALWNLGSEKVLKSNGFEFVRYIEQGYKKHGKWIEENLLAINRTVWLNSKLK